MRKFVLCSVLTNQVCLSAHSTPGGVWLNKITLLSMPCITGAPCQTAPKCAPDFYKSPHHLLRGQVFGEWSVMPAMLLLATCFTCFAGHLHSAPMQDAAMNACVRVRAPACSRVVVV